MEAEIEKIMVLVEDYADLATNLERKKLSGTEYLRLAGEKAGAIKAAMRDMHNKAPSPAELNTMDCQGGR